MYQLLTVTLMMMMMIGRGTRKSTEKSYNSSEELWTFRSLALSPLERKFQTENVRSMRTFALRNFRSHELSSRGTFAPGNESSMELSLPISELGRLTLSATAAVPPSSQEGVPVSRRPHMASARPRHNITGIHAQTK